MLYKNWTNKHDLGFIVPKYPVDQAEQQLFEDDQQEFREFMGEMISEIFASENIDNPTDEQVSAIWDALTADGVFLNEWMRHRNG